MKGKKEITPKIPDSEQSLENHFKQEFVDYAKEKGKDINQDTFWDSANGLLLSFMFQQMSNFYEINANHYARQQKNKAKTSIAAPQFNETLAKLSSEKVEEFFEKE